MLQCGRALNRNQFDERLECFAEQNARDPKVNLNKETKKNLPKIEKQGINQKPTVGFEQFIFYVLSRCRMSDEMMM